MTGNLNPRKTTATTRTTRAGSDIAITITPHCILVVVIIEDTADLGADRLGAD